jgi:hypothetical protein
MTGSSSGSRWDSLRRRRGRPRTSLVPQTLVSGVLPLQEASGVTPCSETEEKVPGCHSLSFARRTQRLGSQVGGAMSFRLSIPLQRRLT